MRKAVLCAALAAAFSPFVPFAAAAFAQNVPVPKFEMGKPVEADAAWTAQAKGSLLVTSGNSQSRNGVLALTAARNQGATKISAEGHAAYGRSSVVVPVVDPATNQLVGLDSREDTTTNQWQVRARLDRFFTENNAAYVLGQLGADKIAGKEWFGGGQFGYSRQLMKSERQSLVAELGYDLAFESYLQPAMGSLDAVQIHSARLFVGEEWKLSETTGLNAGLEALFNLNTERALNAEDRSNEVGPFKDTRLTGKVGLTTKLWKNLSFGFGFTVKYDQNPALRPLPGTAKGLVPAPGFVQPFADKFDTLTEATLVFSFL